MKFSTLIALYSNKATVEIKPNPANLSQYNEPLLELYIQGDKISEHATYTEATNHIIFLIEDSSYDGELSFDDVIRYFTESYMNNDGVTIEDLLSDEFGFDADYMEDSQWRIDGKNLDSNDVSALIKSTLADYDKKELTGIFNHTMDIQIEPRDDVFAIKTED